jgi:hypothetical protein
MYSRLQDAAMYQRLKAAADIVGASVDRLPGVVEMKGYTKVGTGDGFEQRSFEVEDEESDQTAVEDVEYWTPAEVCAFLHKRLLEYEGADEETVNELLRTFEEREVRE